MEDETNDRIAEQCWQDALDELDIVDEREMTEAQYEEAQAIALQKIADWPEGDDDPET